MDNELKEQLDLLDAAVGDLKLKLQGIDKLLGAPYAKDFSEAVVSAMVDDVLRYNMMLNDIYKFVHSRVRDEFREVFFQHITELAKERLKNLE
jgi:hypothetical protein